MKSVRMPPEPEEAMAGPQARMPEPQCPCDSKHHYRGEGRALRESTDGIAHVTKDPTQDCTMDHDFQGFFRAWRTVFRMRTFIPTGTSTGSPTDLSLLIYEVLCEKLSAVSKRDFAYRRKIFLIGFIILSQLVASPGFRR